MHMQIFVKKKKNRVKEIYSWSRGFVFRKKFMIKYKSSMYASKDFCIYFGKKTWSHLLCWFYLYKEFTRHLSEECFFEFLGHVTKGQDQTDGSYHGCCSVHLNFLLETYITWHKSRYFFYLSSLYLTKRMNWKG